MNLLFNLSPVVPNWLAAPSSFWDGWEPGPLTSTLHKSTASRGFHDRFPTWGNTQWSWGYCLLIAFEAAKWGCTTLRKWQSISQVPHQNRTLIDIPPLLDTPRNHMVGHSFRCPWSPVIISNYEPLLANIDHYQPSYGSMIQLSILEFQSGNCVNSHGNIIILTIAIHWGNHVMGYVGYYSPTNSVISELLVMTSTI